MKLLSVFVATGAVAAGVAGGSMAYGSAHTAPDKVEVAQRVYPTPVVRTPAPVHRWAPCPAGTTLQHHVCVRHVTHTVTLPAPVAPAPLAAPAVPAPAPVRHTQAPAQAPAQEAGDDGGRDGGEHEALEPQHEDHDD